MQPIAVLSEKDRALRYPYEAPSGGFVMRGGQITGWDSSVRLDDRLPVLSVGSNRAPSQLLRKFGPAAEIPVSPARLLDCDICHVATVSAYGAVPCSAYPSRGTSLTVNIAWLDRSQLAIMHETETIGIAYDFISWPAAMVEHLAPQLAGLADRLSGQTIYGYASRDGFLDDGAGAVHALAALPARDRIFTPLDQAGAMARLCQLAGFSTEQQQDDWIDRLQSEPALRAALAARTRALARHADDPPWQVESDLRV